MIFVGILLAILAAVLGTVSKQLIAASDHFDSLLMACVGAFLNMGVGPVVDACAYAFAPQVIVAPLACLDVILNAVTAPHTLWWQGEKLTYAHLVGVVLVTLGAVGTSLFADATEVEWTVEELKVQLFGRRTSIIYMIGEVVVVLGALVFLRSPWASPSRRGITLGLLAGLMMGNVFFAAGLLSLIRGALNATEGDAWGDLFGDWLPYLLVFLALAGPLFGNYFMKKGLDEYKGVFMVTIFQGAHITAACLSGTVVMGEMSGGSHDQFLLYWTSVSLIVAGLLSINSVARDAVLDGDKCPRHGPPVSGNVPVVAVRLIRAQREARKRAKVAAAAPQDQPAAPASDPGCNADAGGNPPAPAVWEI